jgi:hypothetical protein
MAEKRKALRCFVHLRALSLVSFAVAPDYARELPIRVGSLPVRYPLTLKRSDYRPWLE